MPKVKVRIEHEVSGCATCPYYKYYDDYFYVTRSCKHPKKKEHITIPVDKYGTVSNVMPKNCPLRKKLKKQTRNVLEFVEEEEAKQKKEQDRINYWKDRRRREQEERDIGDEDNYYWEDPIQW